jgi:ribosomal protein S18 acetylase RimI-like enzyme
MTTDTPQATHLKESQLDEAGEVLGRAFFDDPLTEYLFPDAERRAGPSEWFLRAGANYGKLYGEVHTTPESVDGAACWLPPGEADMSPWRMMRAGMLLAPIKIGIGALRRFLSISDFIEELHHRDMPEDHWYLMLLGVDTAKQGQGVGGSLMAPMLARADAEGLPCYLETMKEINVAFYEKHGFQVVVEDDLPNGGPHFWTMKRPAKG